MGLPILIPILVAAAAAGIGSAAGAHQANQASRVKAKQAEKQQNLIGGAADDMDYYASKMDDYNPYIKDAMGQIDQSYGMFDKGAEMAGNADMGLKALLDNLSQYIGKVENTDYSSQATDQVGRQMNAVNAARGIHGTGTGNANVAGALARVNAEDAGRRQEIITRLMGQQGTANLGRGQLAQVMGGLATGRNQAAGMQSEMASLLAQIAGQQSSLMGQKGNLYAGEAFSNPTQAITASPFWAGVGGAFGGAAQGMGAQISTPSGMAEWMKMFELGQQPGGDTGFTSGQQQFNDWYTENAFRPRQGGNMGQPGFTPPQTAWQQTPQGGKGYRRGY